MSETNGKTALIVGATGLVGNLLLTKLLHSPYYSKVTILTRKSLEIKNTKLTEIIYDFEKPNPSVIAADHIFCCLGTTIKKAGSKPAFERVDLEYPVETAKAARKNGASSFLIVTAMGADPNSSIFYNKVKGEVEKQLKELNYPILHILRPSLLLGDRDEKRLGEKIGASLFKLINPLMIGKLRKYKSIAGNKVANAMFSFAKKPENGIFIHESDELQNF